jgi:hypothetical protein
MRGTGVEKIGKARRRRRCDWCGEFIEVGQPYSRWRYYDGADAGTARMHPECDAAYLEWSALDDCRDNGGEYDLHANRRGCICERNGDGCARCKPAAETSSLQSFPLSAIFQP